MKRQKLVRCPRYQGKPAGHVFDLINFEGISLETVYFYNSACDFHARSNILLDAVSPIDMKQKEEPRLNIRLIVWLDIWPYP